MSSKKLTPEEKHILHDKGTEAPHTGEFYLHSVNGLYTCRQCSEPLYRSYDKFDSGCGWPSFDDEIHDAVIRHPDPDGRRTEIVCANCSGHLGHVFTGEKITENNLRHCVNSLSMQFKSIDKLFELAKEDHPRFGAALFAAGCFWGVEHAFISAPGILATQVGFSGGSLDDPSYEAVCRSDSGHAETVLAIYDKTLTDYSQLLELFFSIHDPSQMNRQGMDVGRQYRSEIFYLNDEQQKLAQLKIDDLKNKGTEVVTENSPAEQFWPAEEYHQHYHKKR